MSDLLSSNEINKQLEERGINSEHIELMLSHFRKGFAPIVLNRPCTAEDGIILLSHEESSKFSSVYRNSLLSLKVQKFVPASGAATRMFKELITEYSDFSEGDVVEVERYPATKRLIKEFERFAFSNDLKSLLSKDGEDYNELKNKKNFREILKALLDESGLNYSNFPKGLIKFHDCGDYRRTAFEEHLVEAKSYVKDKDNICRIHFTVPQNFRGEIQNYLDSVLKDYQDDGTHFEISYSVQYPSTDTIAVDNSNNPVLDESQRLIFRPAGHGALIDNLNSLDCDIVFIKNIDNVVVERHLDEIGFYKEALGGYLLEIQKQVFEYLNILDSEELDESLLGQIVEFCEQKLYINIEEKMIDFSFEEKISFIHEKLDRPIRVCGVVKNLGEPGGGPFWVEDKEGEITLQIVESAQVDVSSKDQEEIWKSSTHFNPVDIVCGVRDYKGNNFDLRKYVDPEAGIITKKSSDGKEIKALELPGLWNGAMSDWVTLYIEVPLITFSPVKTVFDLLRKEHQGI